MKVRWREKKKKGPSGFLQKEKIQSLSKEKVKYLLLCFSLSNIQLIMLDTFFPSTFFFFFFLFVCVCVTKLNQNYIGDEGIVQYRSHKRSRVKAFFFLFSPMVNSCDCFWWIEIHHYCNKRWQ